MAKYNRSSRRTSFLCSLICIVMFAPMMLAASTIKDNEVNPASCRKQLTDTLKQAIWQMPGQVGVAVIINGKDTVAVNNEDLYPMMSVFKLHQAVALCKDFDRRGLSLDSMMTIRRDQLDTATWSPMLKEYTGQEFSLSVRQLLRYSLILSDNNASNYLFEHLTGTSTTDSLIATVIPRNSFHIAYTESQMAINHERAYRNNTTPLGAATLMDRLFSDSLMSHAKQAFIQNTLKECATGKDRLSAPLLRMEGASIAHKTGTGYTTASGLLMAANDVGYVHLPNGVNYSIAVFVKDFNGSEQEASKAIAHLSAIVCSALSRL
ncbi:MAG: class A beta-lactamase [Prevotella sp.]|jgi:beta-lactamase class A